MIWFYNVCRTLSRGVLPVVGGALFSGEIKPLDIKFTFTVAVELVIAAAIVSFVFFCLETWAKKRAGL